MKRAVAVSLCLALLCATGVGQTVGERAPELTFKDLSGRTLRLSDYRGKVVLLNFWATWCAPCRAEMPDLIRWQRRYRARGLRVIGITYPPEDLAEVRTLVRRIKVNYPIAIGQTETKERFDPSDVLPLTVVIDRQGVVRAVIRGIVFPEEFAQQIKPLLSKRV